jgi:hypothetical protein
VTRFLAILLAIANAATAQAQPGYTPAPSFSGPHPSVVRVVVPERDGTAYGSGTLVAVNESSGLIVTNWHVVRDAAGPITVLFPDGFRSGAYLLRTDRDWDLAALAIRRPNVPPVALSNEAPRPGEPVTIAGYGSGSYRAVSGRVTQYVSPGNNQPFEMIELAAPARNGDSGGPILNGRGELAGTLFGSAFGRTTGSYCGRLRWFLNSVDGDFQRISAQAMIAQQSQGAAPPVAAINATGQIAGERQPNSPRPLAGEVPRYSPLPLGEGLGVRAMGGQTVAQAPAYSSSYALPTQALPAPVAAIPASPAGPLPSSDQIKTILAAIGILALLYQALRLLGWAVG